MILSEKGALLVCDAVAKTLQRLRIAQITSTCRSITHKNAEPEVGVVRGMFYSPLGSKVCAHSAHTLHHA